MITNINELENLKSLNNAFLAFLIITFIFTLIKSFAFVCIVCYDKMSEEYRTRFLTPSIMQLIFIIINFGLILAITTEVIKKRRTDAFYVATYHLKRKIKIALANTICFIILFIIELIPSYLDKYYENENKESNRVSHFSSYVPTSSSLNVRVSENVGEVIPKEITEIIKDLEEKINDFIKTFIEEEKKVKDKFDKFLEERHSKLDKFIKDLDKEKNDKEKNKDSDKEKNDKEKNKDSDKEKNDKEKNKEELEKIIKDLNKEEYDCEVDILMNKVNKIHYIFKLGVDVIKKCKDIIVENLKGKMASLPDIAKSKIESQIKEITDSKPFEFLDSTFGKPLKASLEKYGLSRIFIDSLKKELMDERNKRRENERKEFSLEKNTFDDEKHIFEIDLYKFITEEFNDEDFTGKLKKEILGQIIVTNI